MTINYIISQIKPQSWGGGLFHIHYSWNDSLRMLSLKEQQIIVDSMKPYKPTKIGVFGSMARGEERTDSDIDIAYSFDGYFGFFELEDLIDDLERS